MSGIFSQPFWDLNARQIALLNAPPQEVAELVVTLLRHAGPWNPRALTALPRTRVWFVYRT